MFHSPDPQCLLDRSFSGHHQQLSPPPKPDPSSFFPFSPPAFHNDSLHDLLLASHLLPTADIRTPDPSPTKLQSAAAPPPTSSSHGGGLGRKRALRKDRHSKIFTAQGPRDRRMRLSLEVARKFFDLQDMLGFDKASKTVQWLLTMSDSAIKHLKATSRPKDYAFSESSTSECENISTVSDYKGKSSVTGSKPNARKAKRMTVRASRKSTLHPTLARESRAKARARARERTREKKRIHCELHEHISEPNHLASSSVPFETVDDESGSHDLKSSSELVAEVEEKGSPSGEQCKKPSIEREYEFPVGAAVPVGLHYLFDYNHNSISNQDAISLFQEQCNMTMVEERDLLADMQFHARPWEVFNNPTIL